MGIGGALIMPATLSLLTNVFNDPKERGRAIGVWAAVAGAGGAIGPLIGGILLAALLVGLGLPDQRARGHRALVAGRFLLPSSKDADAPRLDPVGAGLSIVGLVAVLWAIIEAPVKGWGDPTVVAVARRRHGDALRLRRLGAALQPPDARRPLLPEPSVHGRQRRDHARLLRHVRGHLSSSPSTSRSSSASLRCRPGPADAADGGRDAGRPPRWPRGWSSRSGPSWWWAPA